MSTKKTREALAALARIVGADAVREGLEEVAAVERAARALVRWNDNGQPLIDADAARGFGVIESISEDAP